MNQSLYEKFKSLKADENEISRENARLENMSSETIILRNGGIKNKLDIPVEVSQILIMPSFFNKNSY